MSLSVPVPVLSAPDTAGPLFSAAAPITVLCAPVTFPDGTLLSPENAFTFGYRLYRRHGGLHEVWDEAGKTWVSTSHLPPLQSLFYQDGQWQTLIVPLGQEDSAGDPWMQTVGGTPRYCVRCTFTGAGPDGSDVVHEGTSGASSLFSVIALGEDYRAGLVTDPAKPEDADRIFLYLKDASLIERGRIEIRRSGSGFVVELTASGARVTLDQSGNILLAPRAGRQVAIDGPVEIDGNLTVTGTINGTSFP